MGRSITPKYVVTVTHVNPSVVSTPSVWNCRESGRPTAANLKRWVDLYHESLKPGGVNEHVARAFGAGAWLQSARLMNNADGSRETVAEWFAGRAREVYPSGNTRS